MKVMIDILVDCVELLSGGILFQQLAGDLPLGSENYSIFGKNTKGSTSVGNGF
jgi:hypothetical protein